MKSSSTMMMQLVNKDKNMYMQSGMLDRNEIRDLTTRVRNLEAMQRGTEIDSICKYGGFCYIYYCIHNFSNEYGK